MAECKLVFIVGHLSILPRDDRKTDNSAQRYVQNRNSFHRRAKKESIKIGNRGRDKNIKRVSPSDSTFMASQTLKFSPKPTGFSCDRVTTLKRSLTFTVLFCF